VIATPRTRSSLTGHPDVQRRRDGYVTFGKGDLAALEELSTEDVVRHVAGRSELAGTHEGRTAVFEFFGNVMELTEGSFRVEPLTLLADDYGCAPVRIRPSRRAPPRGHDPAGEPAAGRPGRGVLGTRPPSRRRRTRSTPDGR
jgi:hypothetical protein